MKYQSKKNAIEAAQAAGSTSRTYKGAARFLIAAARNRTPLHKRGEKPYSYLGSDGVYRGHRDANCKRRWLKTERPNGRLLSKGLAICKEFGLWTLDDAIEAAHRAHERMMSNRHTIAFGDETYHQLRHRARIENPNRRNWDSPMPLVDSVAYSVRTWNHGRYSSRCRYTHYTYQPMIGCWASLRPSGRLEFCYGVGPEKYLAPPRGYRWDADNNGIRIVSLTDARRDYHPDSDDLRNYDRRALAGKASEQFAQRQAAAQKAREELRLEALTANERTRLIGKAEREGCMVCMADALKAGNCRAGVLGFAERHHLDPAKHYKPSQLLRIANGSADRVKLTVASALRRHRHEMAAGYCELAHHQA